MALSRLVTLSISSLRNLDIEANKFYDRAHRLYVAAILTRCYAQHVFRPYIDSQINHIRHFIKIQFATRGLNSLTYPVYLKINLLSLLFLLTLKVRNPLSFVISIINLLLIQEFGLLYVRDLNKGFLCQHTSNHVVRKLQEPYKNFVISGVNESVLSLMP